MGSLVVPGREVAHYSQQRTRSSLVHSHTLDAAARKSLFVDSARFWSMFAVVSLHSAGNILAFLPSIDHRLVFAVEDVMKFGTIAFFIISGFLLGERFETSGRMNFLNRRVKKVARPWLVWFSIQVLYFLTCFGLRHGFHFLLTESPLAVLHSIFISCLTATAFWFIPNLILALCVLLIFRRHLRDLRFGAILLSFNLFHAVNIYTEWVPSSHTVAILGFVFYLWLGAYASRHYNTLSDRLSRISTAVLFACALLAACLSFAETMLLAKLHSAEPLNTLRLSNQIFSVLVVLLLTRVRRRVWPAFMNVRSRMFGIYLTQTLVLAMMGSVAKHAVQHLGLAPLLDNALGFLAVFVLLATSVFLACFALSETLARQPRLAWLVGDSGASQTRDEAPRAAKAGRPTPTSQQPAVNFYAEEMDITPLPNR